MIHNLTNEDLSVFLTVCMLGQPSKGSLKPPWRDVGWPLVDCCHLFYLKQCSSQWMKTECHHELLLCLHDLPGHMTGLDTVKTYGQKNHVFNAGWQNCSNIKNKWSFKKWQNNAVWLHTNIQLLTYLSHNFLLKIWKFLTVAPLW